MTNFVPPDDESVLRAPSVDGKTRVAVLLIVLSALLTVGLFLRALAEAIAPLAPPVVVVGDGTTSETAPTPLRVFTVSSNPEARSQGALVVEFDGAALEIVDDHVSVPAVRGRDHALVIRQLDEILFSLPMGGDLPRPSMTLEFREWRDAIRAGDGPPTYLHTPFASAFVPTMATVVDEGKVSVHVLEPNPAEMRDGHGRPLVLDRTDIDVTFAPIVVGPTIEITVRARESVDVFVDVRVTEIDGSDARGSTMNHDVGHEVHASRTVALFHVNGGGRDAPDVRHVNVAPVVSGSRASFFFVSTSRNPYPSQAAMVRTGIRAASEAFAIAFLADWLLGHAPSDPLVEYFLQTRDPVVVTPLLARMWVAPVRVPFFGPSLVSQQQVQRRQKEAAQANRQREFRVSATLTGIGVVLAAGVLMARQRRRRRELEETMNADDEDTALPSSRSWDLVPAILALVGILSLLFALDVVIGV